MTPEVARAHLAWPEGKDHPRVRHGSGRTWFDVQAGEYHSYWNGVDAAYEDAVMYSVARFALATVAAMQPEYRAEYQTVGGRWFPAPNSRRHRDTWSTKQEAERSAADWKADGYPTRIVRRYVTTPEEIS